MIGWGESDVGIETGSYDAALHMAGIENYNVLLYTSVLPPETVELPHLPDIHHGSVLEGIMAVQHTDKPGTRITAGVLWPRALNERHLKRLLADYIRYHHDDRTHLGLSKETPGGRLRSINGARVVSHARFGGLHHRYQRAA